MNWSIKPWGRTSLLLADDAYEIWLAQACQGCTCSIHLHCDKSNLFHVLEGRVLVRLRNSRDVIIETGSSFTVAAGIPHQFEALTNVSMIEIYQPEPGRLLMPGEFDIVRFRSWAHAEDFIADPLHV